MYTFLFVVMFLSLTQEYNPNPANGPEWYQPVQMLNRKVEAQALQIKELQDRVVSLENQISKDDPIKAALIRRWEAIGDE